MDGQKIKKAGAAGDTGSESQKKKEDRIQELTEQLQKGLEELHQSDKFRDYLKTMAKFSSYSAGNILLIAMQRPDCQAVAGYRAWQKKFERQVVKGAKAIYIIEPAPWKKRVLETVVDADGSPIYDKSGEPVKREVEKTIMSYRVGTVFGVEDTEGKPLPSLVTMLNKDVENFDTLMAVLRKVSPVPIRFVEIEGRANGYYDLENREICVDSRLSQLQQVKTALHEMGHYYAHDLQVGEDIEANQREREVTAEASAFVVATYLGLDVSSYSFGYISGWSSTLDTIELQRKTEVIRKVSHTIISGIEDELQQMQQELVVEEEIEEQQEMLAEVTVVRFPSAKQTTGISHKRR